MERKNFIKQINDVMKSVINIQHSIKNLGGGGVPPTKPVR